jgi:uncharacterized ferredoxin-like protein
MTLIKEENINKETILAVAKKMCIAARTAPKARGVDNIIIVIAEQKEIEEISEKMIEIGEKYGVPSFIRDAKNILDSPAMVLIGTKISSVGLKKCGMCGFKNCDEKNKFPEIPCVFNTGDMGIAIGSAVSVAMDNRVDNRIMYTAGQAVIELELLGEDVKIVYVIPLSATSKNPFFDRK